MRNTFDYGVMASSISESRGPQLLNNKHEDSRYGDWMPVGDGRVCGKVLFGDYGTDLLKKNSLYSNLCDV